MRLHPEPFINNLRQWLRLHGYHLLFGIALLSLASLLSWWSVFIKNAIIQQYHQHYDSIESHMMLQAVILGHIQDRPPPEGNLETDPRLEIVPCSEANPSFHKSLEPFWKNYCIQPKKTVIDDIERRFRRRIIMVVGESALLVILILVSSFMLYRLIWMEKRTTRELHEFWSRVTHEIKTPITGLKSFLETLKSGTLPQADIPHYADLALRQINRQVRLAENILMGRRLSGQIGNALNLKSIRIDRFLEDFLHEQEQRLDTRNLHIIRDIDENISGIADPDALRVIFNNLMDNALKYGGPSVTLNVSLKRKKGNIVLVFKDNGRGFDPQMAGVIFEAYHRLTEELPETVHGTGMGLYISRGLARKMGGDLVASSNGPGRGAAFTLFLKTAGE